MRRTLLLARHGETDWNRQHRWQGHTDIPLNEAGREQARRLASCLRDLGLRRVHASDLSRARETAEIVARTLEIPFFGVDPGLRERGFGVFEGLTREECETRYAEHWARYKADNRNLPPGSEPQELVIARMAEGVRRVAHAGPDHEETVLVVSHGSAIRVLAMHVTGTMPAALGNGAIVKFDVDGDRFAGAEVLWYGLDGAPTPRPQG